MNITMYLPSWELGEPTWRVQQLATGPITEVQLGPAPHPFVVFRDLGDFDTMIGVLVGARAAHGEALSRHAARPLVPERDPDGMPGGWAQMHEELAEQEVLIDPDCIAGKHASCAGGPCECPCGHPPYDDEAQDAADRALMRAGVDLADLAELRGEDG